MRLISKRHPPRRSQRSLPYRDGILVDLRHNLFFRLERPAFAVEQVNRGLSYTTGTSILTVWTRGPVQATIDAIYVCVTTRPATRLRCSPIAFLQHLDSAFL